jgi:Carboxypeptidase regulatory-like domain/TonB-dependent Receptor Plug Domain/TonB dependent receptor
MFIVAMRGCFFAVVGLVGMDLPLCAQVSGGTIQGTVTDTSDAVIPGARISVTNTGTAITRTVVTNEAGFYTVPNLLPGNYRVTAAAPRFSTAVRSGLTLAVAAEIVVNLQLRIDAIDEVTEVSADVPGVDSATSSLSATVNGREVRDLPLNARDWTQLATLQPGVVALRLQTPLNVFLDRANRGLGTQLAIGGNRPQQNNYRIDGVSINDYSNGAPGSALGQDLGVDAIQEFSVITGNAPADYGRSSGGVINAITCSGANRFHGSAFEFLRNSVLDARNFFDGPAVPPLRRNQFGAAAGGPIRKDRTFFFATYEGQRQSLSATQLAVVPAPAARTGHLAAGTVVVDPHVKPYLDLYPLPSGPIQGDTGTFTSVTRQLFQDNFLVTRADHKFSDVDSLHGTYMLDDSKLTAPDLLETIVAASLTRRQLATMEETHIFTPSLVNILRVGVSRVSADAGKSAGTIVPQANDPAFGFVPGRPVGAIQTSGLSTYAGGTGAAGEVNYHFTSYQAYNDSFWTKGIHSLRFGGAFERIHDNELGRSVPNGVFAFGSLRNFLTGTPTSFSAALSTSVAPRAIRQTILGAYVQDEIHLKPNLTVNLGARYEPATVPVEANGKLTNLRDLSAAQPRLGSPYFLNPTLRNVAPRVGFSWDPFHAGATAVRGGFGFYDVLPLTYEFNVVSYLSAPFFQRGNIANPPPGSFPSAAFSLLGPNQIRYSYVEYQPHRNYVMQWNFNIQRQLARSLTATLGYAGTRGVHQPFRAEDANIVLPSSTPQGYVWPTPSGSGTRLNSSLGQINGLFWKGSSVYHALQSHITGKMSRGLELGASYTWSKSLDTSSATVISDAFLNSVAALPWFDPRLTRGLSDFDLRHLLAANVMWRIPGPAAASGFAGWLITGWQLGAIYQASTGLPFTARIGGDPLGLKSAITFAFPDRLADPGCDSLVNPGNATQYIRTGCFAFPNPITRLGNSGRNVLIGPGLSNLDLSLFKNNPVKRISEAFNLQFRAEIFNALNHTNFAPPVTTNTLFNSDASRVSNAGLLTSTTTTSRQLQFALKVIW